MEIQSAFNTGVQGFQNARESAEQAAADIVASTSLSNTDRQNTSGAETNTEVTNQVATNTEVPDLNQSIVDLKVAEFQAKASAEVIKSADDSLGTLLDVTA